MKALKYLVRVSPSGEMQDVIHHIAVLVGGQENLEQSPEIIAALRKFYETHRYHIVLPNGKSGLVTAGGNAGDAENGDFIYYDNILGLSFSFNPFTLAANIVSEEPMEIASGPTRDSLVTSLTAYTAKAYRKGKVLFSV